MKFDQEKILSNRNDLCVMLACEASKTPLKMWDRNILPSSKLTWQEKMELWRCISYWKWGISIAMLVHQRVYVYIILS